MARTKTRSFGRLSVDRFRQDRGLRLLTAGTMVGFVVVVYVVVVVGGGGLLGLTATPSLWLSVLATAMVAIGFGPVQTRVKRSLSGALHRDRMSPYQVLAHFPTTVTGAYPAADLPGRMVRVLAEGTGTARAELWLAVQGRLELAASWPAKPMHPNVPHNPTNGGTGDVDTEMSATTTAPKLGPDRPDVAPVVVVDGARHTLAVRERGELLGALAVVVRDGQQLTPVEGRLFAGLAAQSGLMLRVAGLHAELEQQLVALERRAVQLRDARRDLVARQDSERQRLERNIHDGAQQEVIALLVSLRLAQTLLGRSPERGARLLADQAAAARATIDTLTALSRGLYPRMLTEAGPLAALTVAVASAPIPVDLSCGDLPRCPLEVEAAVYFTCLEAVQNACKHSGATCITIDIRGRFGGGNGPPGEIELTVVDDGRGFDTSARTGNGLSNIGDRIDCVRGVVSITSSDGNGTAIRASIPALPLTVENDSTAADRSPGAARVAAPSIVGG